MRSFWWAIVPEVFQGICGERADQPNHDFNFARPILEPSVEPEFRSMTASKGFSRLPSEWEGASALRHNALLDLHAGRQQSKLTLTEGTYFSTSSTPSDGNDNLLTSSRGDSTLPTTRKDLTISKKRKVPETAFRPTLYENTSENISVNMQVTKVTYIDVYKEAAEFRFILTTKWVDDRIIHQVPFVDGQDELTLTVDAASNLIWMPELRVANIDFKPAVETTSAVTLNRNGSAVKEQWMVVTTNQNLEGTNYPFDVQTLKIILVPRYLPAEEMMLYAEGDKTVHYNQDAFDHTEYTAVSSQHSVNVVSHRSRYVLSIHVVRNSKDLWPQFVYPNIIIMGMAYTSLFMPLAGFAGPRGATLFMAYWSQRTMANREATMVPKEKPSVWLWSLQKQMQGFLLFIFIFNVLNENVSKRDEDMARSLRKEMRACAMLFAVATYALLLMFEKYETASLQALLAMDAAAFLYILSVVFRLYFLQD